jgi:hypothetical protein
VSAHIDNLLEQKARGFFLGRGIRIAGFGGGLLVVSRSGRGVCAHVGPLGLPAMGRWRG